MNSNHPTIQVHSNQRGRTASTAVPVASTAKDGIHMPIVDHLSPTVRLEAERDAALAAFAHLAPRVMQAAERDDIEAAALLLALQRCMDWLEDAGLSFEDASAARLRVTEARLDRGVAA